MNQTDYDFDNIPFFPPSPPRWEIKKLILSVTGPTREGHRQLLGRLRNTDKDKAGFNLHELMESGIIDSHLSNLLPDALGKDPKVVADAMEKTSQQQAEYAKAVAFWEERKARRDFHPHIAVHVDIRQRKILIVGLCLVAKALRIDVPNEFPNQPERIQISKVQELISDYANTENGRRCSNCYPGPTGFSYFPTFDESWHFSVDGELTHKGKGFVSSGQVAANNLSQIDPPNPGTV